MGFPTVSTPYHPQTNGLAEVSNQEIKRILEWIVKPSNRDWSLRLDYTQWAYRIGHKTPIGMSPYQIIYGKSCHIPVELEHQSYWAVKSCNADLEEAGLNRLLQIQELEEIWLDAYNSSNIYKQKTKLMPHTKKLESSGSKKKFRPREETRLPRKKVVELFANRG
ncbi:uncharacterized protein LOC114759595 [Neltuma alba]|uniref:uncharacterized protein LOC114759595 n=1 Tax=Neltuma alba TaxID=207710 RepID=UPI0010A42F79|nr:uncharacterized protein LOC114759595 [Prosopis alba]